MRASVDGGVDAQAQNVSVVGFTGGNEMKFSLVSESNGYAIRPFFIKYHYYRA